MTRAQWCGVCSSLNPGTSCVLVRQRFVLDSPSDVSCALGMLGLNERGGYMEPVSFV